MQIYGTPQTQALNQRSKRTTFTYLPRFWHLRRRPMASGSPISSRLLRPIFPRGPRRSSSSRISWAVVCWAKKSPIIYYDNPAGKEPLPVLEDLQKTEGFELRTFAVPPPGVELGAQVLDISQRYRPDFVIAHCSAARPRLRSRNSSGPAIRCQSARPGLGLGRADINAAGGWAVAEGYQYACSSPAPATTIRSAGNQGDVQEGGEGAAEDDGRHRRL